MLKSKNSPVKGPLKTGAAALMALLLALALCTPALAVDNSQVASGGMHYMAVKPDGSLWTWGYNYYGQLGNGNHGMNSDTEKPAKVLADVVAADGGSDHTIALKSDGSLWAWGRNDFGQLGDGTRTDSLKPKKVMEDVRCISAGGATSAAVKKDGSLWVWGRNDYTYDTPQKVMEDVVSVTTNGSRTFAVKKDGTLWAWGDYWNYELGNGKKAKQTNYPDHQTKPIQIMDNVKDVAVGRDHTLVLKKDATVWAFGENDSGQLGDGTKTDRKSPVKVMDSVQGIATGNSHSLAVKKDGTLWAWGSNRQSQAAGTGASVTTPMKIMGDVSAAASAGPYSLAMKRDGSLWFWWNEGVSGAGNSNEYTGIPERILKG